ncbi:MAG: NAD(P)-binding domain-containing protein, partial [Blastocatellia bacterium]
VDNRACMSCHNDQYKFRGRMLGAPHKGSEAKSNRNSQETPGVGYIRVDGVPSWNNRTGKEAVLLFHAEHPYAREQKCLYCHQGNRGTDEWEKSPRAACQACHAVSFDAQGVKAIGPNCATCHKQHGQHKGLKLALNRLSDSELRKFIHRVRSNGLYSLGDTTEEIKPPEIGGATAKRSGLVNWSWAFVSRLGIVPWHLWTAPIGIFALGGTVLIAFGNARRRKLLRDESERGRIVQAYQETEENHRRLPPTYTFPRIDPDRCIGCHACIEACPHDVLSMSHEHIATPIALTQCMDDTRCQVACPTQACIVANTKKEILERDRPERSAATYMTNVPGLYVIGEVARIPLIRYAIVEGAYVIDQIDKELKQKVVSSAAQYDVAIIGAGPAGLSAAIRAVEHKLSFVLLERQEALATIKGYPKGKSVNLKILGDEPRGLLPLPTNQEQRRKEQIIEYWTGLIASNKLKINEHEECVNIEGEDELFTVTTERGDGRDTITHRSRKIVLAIGSSGTPSLDVKGAQSKIQVQRPSTKCPNCNSPRAAQQEVCSTCNMKIDESFAETYLDDRVKYRLTDPGAYQGRKCVVVGGGNSAVEAAVALTGFVRCGNEIEFTLNNHVTLLVRSDFTPDLKFVNKMNLVDCWDAGRIEVRFKTEIKEIREGEVILKNKRNEEIGIPNDYVFCCIGTQWPQRFLEGVGIKILTGRSLAAH